MAPKQRTSASVGAPQTTTSTPARPSKSTGSDAQDILQGIYNKYVQKTPQRVKLLDTFMTFLVVVGALQFFYVVLVGNFVRTPAFYTSSSRKKHSVSMDSIDGIRTKPCVEFECEQTAIQFGGF
jgi:hypothetical protein